jgi:IS1 family transposase
MFNKKSKLWIFKALDRATFKTIAWVVGKRNKMTLQKLYDKLSHLKATFYTDTGGRSLLRFCHRIVM